MNEKTLTPADLDRIETAAKRMAEALPECWPTDSEWRQILTDLVGNTSSYLATLCPADVLALVATARVEDEEGAWKALANSCAVLVGMDPGPGAVARHLDDLTERCVSVGRRAGAFEVKAHEWKVVAKKAQGALRWIPVGERLPEEGRAVLLAIEWTAGNGALVREMVIGGLRSGGRFYSSDDDLVGATHWTPLPEGPGIAQ